MDRTVLEQKVKLAEELAQRRAQDPLKNYDLHEKQKAFVNAVLYSSETTENWFIAANRSGKSDAGAYIGAHLARFGDPNPPVAIGKVDGSTIEVRDRATSGWVSALDFPTARDVVQPKYFDNGFAPPGCDPFIPRHEIKDWRVDDQILRLKNGSIIGFKSADSGRRKYQGAEKDWFHMDEEHPFDIYEEAVIRVGRKPLKFFCTATILPPEGERGHTVSWVFPRIIQPFMEGRLKHVGVFGASIYDNPGISRDEIKRLESIYPEGSLARRIRLEGEWLPGIGGSRAYAAFDRLLHVQEQPPLNLRRPLIWTWDFNVEPMVSLIGQSDGMVYRIYREIVMDDASIPEMCAQFYRFFPNHLAEIWIYGDATSERRVSQTGKTDYYVILQEMKRYGVPVRIKVPEQNPHVADRINAVNRLCRDEEGRIRLSVDPSCLELIADLEGVLRDERGGIKKSRNRKDPYFRRTHTSDALGYWLAFEEPVRPPSDNLRTGLRIKQPGYKFAGR